MRNGKLLAVKDDNGDYYIWFAPAPSVVLPRMDPQTKPEDEKNKPIDFPVVAVLSNAVLYFIPEHAQDPTPRRNDGTELWAEVTIPKQGPPRPIQLALKKDGAWTPLDLH